MCIFGKVLVSIFRFFGNANIYIPIFGKTFLLYSNFWEDLVYIFGKVSIYISRFLGRFCALEMCEETALDCILLYRIILVYNLGLIRVIEWIMIYKFLLDLAIYPKFLLDFFASENGEESVLDWFLLHQIIVVCNLSLIRVREWIWIFIKFVSFVAFPSLF